MATSADHGGRSARRLGSLPYSARLNVAQTPRCAGYGSTETGSDIGVSWEDGSAGRDLATIDKPLFGRKPPIVNEWFEAFGPREVGKLLVRGPSMNDRYWRNHESTDEPFHGDWYRTGDLARRDDKGFKIMVFVVPQGRADVADLIGFLDAGLAARDIGASSMRSRRCLRSESQSLARALDRRCARPDRAGRQDGARLAKHRLVTGRSMFPTVTVIREMRTNPRSATGHSREQAH